VSPLSYTNPLWAHISLRLDSVGVAGFSHDFGTLQGKHSTIAEVFDSFGKLKPTFFQIMIFVLSVAFPIFARTPSPRKTLVKKFKLTTEEISRELLERTRKEKEGTAEGKGDQSIIGLLSMCLIHSSSLFFFWFSTIMLILVLNIQSRRQTTAQSCICLKKK
jgi:hypothetical protein